MDYYNRQQPHQYNKGMTPVVAEGKFKHCPELVDHYTSCISLTSLSFCEILKTNINFNG